MVFVMKLGWLDPDLKNFKSRISVRETKGTSNLHLRKLDVVITKMYANGDVEFIDLSDSKQRVQTLRKGEYFGIQDPDWNEYFFPSYTILNLKHGADATVETRRLLWCDEAGGFTSFCIRFDAKLQETMDLRNFPRDRQLCRTDPGSRDTLRCGGFLSIGTCPGFLTCVWLPQAMTGSEARAEGLTECPRF